MKKIWKTYIGIIERFITAVISVSNNIFFARANNNNKESYKSYFINHKSNQLSFFKLIFSSLINHKILVLSALLILIGAPIAFLKFKYQPKIEAAWYDDTFAYRQTVAITNSGAAQTDFQVAITLDTAALITAGKMQSDCDDIRVTDVNGKVLPYWLSSCNTVSTIIWPKIPTISTTGTTVYLYYGNSIAQAGKTVIGTQTYPGLSCKSILDAGNSSGNTTYWIDPTNGNSSDTFQTYCDMTNDSGGWMLVTSSMISSQTNTATSTTQTTGSNGGLILTTTITTPPTACGGQHNYQVLLLDTIPWTKIKADYEFTGSASCWAVFGNTSYGVGANLIPFASGTDTIRNQVRMGGATGGDNFDGINSRCDNETTNFWHGNNGTSARSAQVILRRNSMGSLAGLGSGSNCNGTTDWKYQNIYVRENSMTSSTVTAGTPTNEEKSTGPVAYWKMDEGVDNTCSGGTNDVCDSTQHRYDGSNIGVTWKTEDQCISGKCLYFDGTIGSWSNLNTSAMNGISDFTVGYWMKSSDTVKAGTAIHATNTGNNEFIAYNYQNLTVYVRDSAWSSGVALTDGKWHFVNITRNGTSGLVELFVDGVSRGSNTLTSGALTVNCLVLGQEEDGVCGAFDASQAFLGNLDEVKIYSYVRSTTQIKSDFASKGSGSVKGTSAQMGTNVKNSDAFSNGLVGYWKMDEASWNGTTGEVIDSSGNGQNGTAISASTTSGKFGNAGSFNGSSGYVGASFNTSFSAFSSSFWVKFNSLSNTYNGTVTENISGSPNTSGWTAWYDNGGCGTGFRIWMRSNNVNPMGNCGELTSFVPTVGTWYHITQIWDSTGDGKMRLYVNGDLNHTSTGLTNTAMTGLPNKILIGALQWADANLNSVISSQTLNGQIDDVRIYNRALSPKEVRDLYSWAPGPVGYWNMEEGTGTSTVNDSSGNGNTATMNSLTSSDWVSGKFGKGLQFNNSDYLSVSVNSWIRQAEYVTISGWYYHTGDTTGAPWGILTTTADPDKDGFWWHLKYSGGPLYLRTEDNTHSESDGTGTAFVSTGNWYYLTTIVGTNKFDVYVNGVLYWSWTPNNGFTWSTINNGTAYLYIGKSYQNDNSVNGIVDDVKIYNYARSSKQIVEDMNAGHPAGGSPVGSQVGYWKFDEGYGSAANNSGSVGSTINGSISGATWSNNGKFGKTLNFDGISNYVSIPDNDALDLTNNFTISGWINPAALQANGTILTKSAWAYYTELHSNGKLRVYLTGTTNPGYHESNSAISPNTWTYFVWTYDGVNVKIYLNGVLDRTIANTGSVTTTTGAIRLGSLSGLASGYDYKGLIDEVKIYNSALTEDEIKLDYNRGSAMVLGATSTEETPKSLSGLVFWVDADAPSTITQSTGVSQWNDKSGMGNNVTQATGSRQPSYVQSVLNGRPVVRFVATNSQTMTTSTNFASPVSVIYVARQTGSYSRILSGLNNNWLLGFWGGCHQQAYHEGWLTSSCGGGPPGSDTNWYIQSTVETGSLSTYYENGTQIVSNANGVQGPNGLSLVGHLGSSEFSNADIAEIVLYNRALSDAERQKVEGYLAQKWGLQSNLPSTATYKSSGPPNTSNSNLSNYCIPGDSSPCFSPVGEWKFEEKTGTNAYDTSGNGNTGTWAGTGNRWSTGKIGTAGQFNGSDDVVTVGTSSIIGSGTSPFTASMWFYPTRNLTTDGQWYFPIRLKQTTQFFFSFYKTGGVFYALPVFRGSTQLGTAVDQSTIINRWNHLTVIYNGGDKSTASSYETYINGVKIATGSVNFGTAGGSCNDNAIGSDADGSCNNTMGFFGGNIDQIRIYNYARTPAQIAYDYNRGAPVGHWKFDECQGGTANDSSGNNNTGTITIGATGSQTAVGTCITSGTAWYNGATGKYNSSLNFDGSDDYVNGAYNFPYTSNFTVSAWVYPQDNNVLSTIVSTESGCGGSGGGWSTYYNDNGSDFYFQWGVGNANNWCYKAGNNHSYNNWYHVVGVAMANGNQRLYVNGVLEWEITSSYSAGCLYTTNNGIAAGNDYEIGRYPNNICSGRLTKGQIDDVRVYNYAITAEQVKSLYNQGSSIRFGPATGSP